MLAQMWSFEPDEIFHILDITIENCWGKLNKIRFEKVHDLLALMKLCLPLAPELELQKELLSYLNPFAVLFRYPGESATREEAHQAVQALKTLRPILRTILGFID